MEENSDNYILALKLIENSDFTRKEKDLITKGADVMFHIAYWRGNANKNLFPENSLRLFLDGLEDFKSSKKVVKNA